ncbi:hypothetical protein [Undibacterium sp. Tian12W]|uniref:hypothetical protein n=1 Tax=Undibacterium sp. Tian12W TaxID=3413054 RepID=UPI003BF38719
MIRTEHLENLILQELHCYYHANVVVWSKEGFSSLAEQTAIRLHDGAPKEMDALISLLDEVRSNRQHVFLDFLIEETWIEWREDSSWHCLQIHLKKMTQHLKRLINAS